MKLFRKKTKPDYKINIIRGNTRYSKKVSKKEWNNPSTFDSENLDRIVKEVEEKLG